jgi:cytochrome c oxidase assembly protein subunit 15
LHAGLIYNTWPLIDGRLVPDSARMFFETPLWRNFFENALTVQFNHRLAAYLLWLLALLHAIDVAHTMRAGTALVGALGLLVAVTLQGGLGIVTLLQGSPLPLALAHQAMAAVVLTIAVIHAERLHERAHPAALAEIAGRALSRGKQAT